MRIAENRLIFSDRLRDFNPSRFYKYKQIKNETFKNVQPSLNGEGGEKMKYLLKKIKNKKGFTLMEMLIVVAIIVILVAVSVPVFSSQLNKAKEATDDANFRSAKSAAVAAYYVSDTEYKAGTTYYFDADQGTITTTKPTAYGQSTANQNKVVEVTFDDKGNVTCTWK